jgi:hypothetical protein
LKDINIEIFIVYLFDKMFITNKTLVMNCQINNAYNNIDTKINDNVGTKINDNIGNNELENTIKKDLDPYIIKPLIDIVNAYTTKTVFGRCKYIMSYSGEPINDFLSIDGINHNDNNIDINGQICAKDNYIYDIFVDDEEIFIFTSLSSSLWIIIFSNKTKKFVSTIKLTYVRTPTFALNYPITVCRKRNEIYISLPAVIFIHEMSGKYLKYIATASHEYSKCKLAIMQTVQEEIILAAIMMTDNFANSKLQIHLFNVINRNTLRSWTIYLVGNKEYNTYCVANNLLYVIHSTDYGKKFKKNDFVKNVVYETYDNNDNTIKHCFTAAEFTENKFFVTVYNISTGEIGNEFTLTKNIDNEILHVDSTTDRIVICNDCVQQDNDYVMHQDNQDNQANVDIIEYIYSDYVHSFVIHEDDMYVTISSKLLKHNKSNNTVDDVITTKKVNVFDLKGNFLRDCPILNNELVINKIYNGEAYVIKDIDSNIHIIKVMCTFSINLNTLAEFDLSEIKSNTLSWDLTLTEIKSNTLSWDLTLTEIKSNTYGDSLNYVCQM